MPPSSTANKRNCDEGRCQNVKAACNKIEGLGKRVTFHGVLIVSMIAIVIVSAKVVADDLGEHKNEVAKETGKTQTELAQHNKSWEQQQVMNGQILDKLNLINGNLVRLATKIEIYHEAE